MDAELKPSPKPSFVSVLTGDVYEYTWEKAVVYLDSQPNGRPVSK